MGILFGPAVGSFVDTHDRLRCMRLVIIGQNVAITMGSVVFWASMDALGSTSSERPGWLGAAYFAILCAGGLAKVAATGAKVALHKDWIPTGQTHARRENYFFVCVFLPPHLVPKLGQSEMQNQSLHQQRTSTFPGFSSASDPTAPQMVWRRWCPTCSD